MSQLIRGTGPSPSQAVLQSVLEVFPSANDKEGLYQAWINSFVPSPTDSAIPEPWDSDELIQSFAWQAYLEIPKGRTLDVFRGLERLWQALKRDDHRSESALMVGRTLSEVSFLLDRPFVGAQVSSAMREIAITQGNPPWIARSLWLQALAVRLGSTGSYERALTALSELESYLLAWQPSEGRGGTNAELRECLQRDFLLTAVDAHHARRDYYPLIKQTVGAMHPEDLAPGDDSGLGHESLARGLIALGELDKATAEIEAAKTNLPDAAPHNVIKLVLSDIRLMLASGKTFEETLPLLSVALDMADSHGFVRYRHQLQKIIHEQIQMI